MKTWTWLVSLVFVWSNQTQNRASKIAWVVGELVLKNKSAFLVGAGHFNAENASETAVMVELIVKESDALFSIGNVDHRTFH